MKIKWLEYIISIFVKTCVTGKIRIKTHTIKLLVWSYDLRERDTLLILNGLVKVVKLQICISWLDKELHAPNIQLLLSNSQVFLIKYGFRPPPPKKKKYIYQSLSLHPPQIYRLVTASKCSVNYFQLLVWSYDLRERDTLLILNGLVKVVKLQICISWLDKELHAPNIQLLLSNSQVFLIKYGFRPPPPPPPPPKKNIYIYQSLSLHPPQIYRLVTASKCSVNYFQRENTNDTYQATESIMW